MDNFTIHGTVKAPSRRIVSLAPSITELLFYLGMGDSVIGVTRQCDYPAAVKEEPVIGSFLIPDATRILELSPDTVIGLGNLHKHVPELIDNERVGIILLDYHSVQNILGVMEAVSSLAVESQKALKIVASLQQRVDVLRQNHTGKTVRILFLINESPIMIPSRHSYQYDALRITGATQLANSYTQYERVTLEEVVYFDPEVIFACGRHKGEPLPQLCPDCHAAQPICQRIVEDIALKPQWKETSAAVNGNIITTPCHWLCRPGPRLIDGMESIFTILRRHNHG